MFNDFRIPWFSWSFHRFSGFLRISRNFRYFQGFLTIFRNFPSFKGFPKIHDISQDFQEFPELLTLCARKSLCARWGPKLSHGKTQFFDYISTYFDLMGIKMIIFTLSVILYSEIIATTGHSIRKNEVFFPTFTKKTPFQSFLKWNSVFNELNMI